MSYGAEFKAEAANVDGGGALGLTQQIGDGDLLRTEAFGDANGPLAADRSAGDGVLREDVAGGNVGRVEAILQGEAEAEGAGLFARVGEREAGEVRDFDLAAVNGEAHGDEGGEQRDDEHGKRAEEDVEEAVDAADFQLHRSASRIQLRSGCTLPPGSRAVMIGVCVRIWPALLRSFAGTLERPRSWIIAAIGVIEQPMANWRSLRGDLPRSLSGGASCGDRVVLWGENSAEWIGVFFGCLLRGVIAVPLDAAGSSEFAGRVVKDVSPKLMVGDQGLLRW